MPWMNKMNSGTVVPKCGTAPPAPHLRDAGRRASGVNMSRQTVLLTTSPLARE